MLYDIEFDWIICVGILIGLSLGLSYISEEKMSLFTILIYMNVIDAFIVSTGLLPLWTLVLLLLLVVGSTILNNKKNRSESIMQSW